MKKIIILIPVYNDWQSLDKLIKEINENIKVFREIKFDCLVINDASATQPPEIAKPDKFGSLEILSMKKNLGHARCNAFGIRYVFKNKEFDYLLLMDGDGEDRPTEIKNFIEQINNDPTISVVARRAKRSEGLFFQLLYQAHKLITIIFTGKNINFGNYSMLTKDDVGKLHTQASLWSSFSGSVKKHLRPLNRINSLRGLRYFGPSKMSFLKLVIHSFSIIAVFKYQVFFRSTLMIMTLAFLNSFLGNITIFIQILIAIFNLVIFLVSKREIEADLNNSQDNLCEVKKITF